MGIPGDNEHMKTEELEAWTQIWSGKPFDYLSDNNVFGIADIGACLGKICRYMGNCDDVHYSVAEHSVHVSRCCPPEHRLWGLLHDASEFVTGDIPRDFKSLLSDFRAIERRIMRQVAKKFGLSWPEPAIVKELDTRILINEKASIMRPGEREWKYLRGLEPLPIHIECWDFRRATEIFLAEYRELTRPTLNPQRPDWVEPRFNGITS